MTGFFGFCWILRVTNFFNLILFLDIFEEVRIQFNTKFQGWEKAYLNVLSITGGIYQYTKSSFMDIIIRMVIVLFAMGLYVLNTET